MLKRLKAQIKKGVTLIEMLAAVTIFSIIIGAISGLFISAVRSQRRVLATQELLNQTSYAMEYMSRALRMAKKDDIGVYCLLGDKVNYEITRGGQGIKFRNYKDDCQEFYREGNQLKEDKNGIISELTSSEFQVTSFNIGSDASWDQNDADQPRVTIFLEILGREIGVGERPVVKIQTSISQRDLDVQY